MPDPTPDPAPQPSPYYEPLQQVRVKSVGARVPAHLARGSFCTGAIVMSGAAEVVIDFLQQLTRPHSIVARVALPHVAVPQIVRALEQNVTMFEQQFGAVPPLPKPDPAARRPSIEEVYDSLKLSEEMQSGVYANGCIISHTAAEFCLDFVTNFFPNPSVSARLFLSAPHIPPLLESLKNNLRQQQQSREKLKDQAPPATTGEGDATA